MQFLEILFYLATTTLLVRLVIEEESILRIKLSAVCAVGLVILVLHLVDGPRWQLLPGYLVFAALFALSFKRGRSNRVVRTLGSVLAGVLICFSVFLSHQMPILKLPEPPGPFPVGTFSYSVTDESRIERYDPKAETNRELFIRVWYPGAKEVSLSAYPALSLWNELYEGPSDPLSLFTGYLRRVKTHSHIQMPVAMDDAPYPVLLYNHSLGGWTSQNTLLMEHLASHGYVIFAIAHPYESLKVHLDKAGTVLVDFNGPPNESLTAQAREDYETIYWETLELPRPEIARLTTEYLSLLAEMRDISDADDQFRWLQSTLEKGSISPMIKRNSPAAVFHFLKAWEYNSDVVSTWAQDTRFVADHLSHLNTPVKGFSDSLNIRQLSAFGHSLGGAVATEFCKTDLRCKGAINMDGHLFGHHWRRPLRAPFMMLYSEPQSGINDYGLLPREGHYFEYTIEGAHHADFTDVPLVMPLVKTLPLNSPLLFGEVTALQMNRILNLANQRFFDHYLKGEPLQSPLVDANHSGR